MQPARPTRQYVVFALVGLFYTYLLLFLGGVYAGFTTLGLVVLLSAVCLFVGASAASLFQARAGAAIALICSLVLVLWASAAAVTDIMHTRSSLSLFGALLVIPGVVAFFVGVRGVRASTSLPGPRRATALVLAAVPAGLVAAYLAWLIPQLSWRAA